MAVQAGIFEFGGFLGLGMSEWLRGVRGEGEREGRRNW